MGGLTMSSGQLTDEETPQPGQDSHNVDAGLGGALHYDFIWQV
jgi:hypothetical protein